MKYQTYPEYKDSGVEMLGNLPNHWSEKQVRFLLRDGGEGIKIGPFGSALKLEDMVDSGVRVYGQENVIKKDFSLGKRIISNEKFEEMRVYQILPDDLLITMMGTSGKCELVPDNIETGIIDSHLLRLRVNESEILPRFFRLLIDECYEIENQIKILGKGSIMHGLNSSIVKELRLPLPSLDEQKNILNFLDHETAKIDTLIEKQQRLIELLKEKRQAVISHAVTKGLNPNAPMKDSGVEWLGEVPDGWKVSKLKYITKQIVDGTHFTPTYVENGIPFLRVTDIQTESIDIESVKFIPVAEHLELTKRAKPEKEDILLSKNGTIGITKVVNWDWEFSIFVSLCLIKFLPSISPYYFSYFFESDVVNQQISEGSKKTSVTNLHLEKIRELLFCFPLLSEQQKIVDYLLEKTTKFDNLIEKSNSAIELMQERRTALISAAVTGKIDVRNWNAPNA